MMRLPRRHRAVPVALRIDELTHQEVAACYHLSLRSVDATLGSRSLHCSQMTGKSVTQWFQDAQERRACGLLMRLAHALENMQPW